jgi:hypothetical protein
MWLISDKIIGSFTWRASTIHCCRPHLGPIKSLNNNTKDIPLLLFDDSDLNIRISDSDVCSSTLQIKLIFELTLLQCLCYFYTRPNLVIYFNLKIQVFCNVTQRHIPKDINHLTKPLSEPQVSSDINLPFHCISPLTIPHFSLLFFPIYPSQIYPLDVSISLYFSLYHISLFSILLSRHFSHKASSYLPVSL